jgi:hypothetical protein
MPERESLSIPGCSTNSTIFAENARPSLHYAAACVFENPSSRKGRNAMTAVQGIRLDAGTYEVGGMIPEGLSREGLMIYLQTRLTSLDDQIDRIFEKQRKVEAIRKELNAIQLELDKLKTDPNNPGTLLDAPGFEEAIRNRLDAIREIDPKLADALEVELNTEGNALWVQDGKYYSQEIEAGKKTIDNTIKQLEASAQLEMIALQSMMSSRQTAVQLSTNMISALGETTRSIAANVGK